MKLGYACINMTLQQSGGITTNRGMRQKTFNELSSKYPLGINQVCWCSNDSKSKKNTI